MWKFLLRELVKAGNQFRNTPIVDDDFSAYRNRFDFLLKSASKSLKQNEFPVIVCLCGSTRFSEAFRQANLEETLAGRIVLTVGCDTKSDSALGLNENAKKRLDELHMRKIDLADEVLILNVGGYIGESTGRELEYARSQGKRIRFLSDSQHTES